MQDTVLFNGINSLDFQDVRANVIRIPEVCARISAAQKIWDTIDRGGFNFYNFLAFENEVFLSNIKLKSLASAIVQIGLYDRYVKQNKKPQYMVGCSNGDSVLKVCAGEITFEEMILNSDAAKTVKPVVPIMSLATSPKLSGISLSEFAVYHLGEEPEEAFKPIDADKMDVQKILNKMIEDHAVKRIVNIGPGSQLLNKAFHDLSMRDIQILESIDLDPMLSWFWRGVQRPEPVAMAQ